MAEAASAPEIRVWRTFRAGHRSRRSHEAGLEQVEICSTEHLALDELQPVDLAFDLTTGSRFGDCRGHGVLVRFDTGGEACEFAFLGGRDPWLETGCVFGAHHRVETVQHVAGRDKVRRRSLDRGIDQRDPGGRAVALDCESTGDSSGA